MGISVDPLLSILPMQWGDRTWVRCGTNARTWHGWITHRPNATILTASSATQGIEGGSDFTAGLPTAADVRTGHMRVTTGPGRSHSVAPGVVGVLRYGSSNAE